MQFRMPADAQARYSIPEWVTFDASNLSLNEAIALEEEVGWTVAEFAAQLDIPVMNPDGTPKVNAEGVQIVRTGPRAMKFLIWAAAVRSGAKASFADFDAPYVGIEQRSDSQPDPKDEATEDPSTPESLSGESEADSATS
jgi:hypothetical protein